MNAPLILTGYGVLLIAFGILYLHQRKIMKQLDDLIASEATEAGIITTLATSVKTLLASDAQLRADLAAAIAANGTLPQDVQDGINAALNASQANVDGVKAILADVAPPAPTTGTGTTATDTSGGS